MQSGAPYPGKRYRFNSPPGWPTYPPEWVPPPGWRPDPSWPPPPPGWPFWSEIAPPQNRQRRPLNRIVQVGVAVVSFIATVVGLVAAIHSWPKGVTEADWAKKANQTCEKYQGDIMQPLLTVSPQLSQLQQGGNADTNQLVQISVQVGSISGAFSKLTSDMEGIEAPKNDQNINDLIKTSQDISAEFAALAAVVNRAAMKQTTDSDAASVNQADKRFNDVSLLAWDSLSTTLHMDQCVQLTSQLADTSTPASTSPSPSPAQLTAAQQSLAAQLRTSVLTSCIAAPIQLPPGVVAALDCQAVATGPTKLPLVMQFSNLTAMNSWLKSGWEAGITQPMGTVCSDGDYQQQWQSQLTPNLRAGELVCVQAGTNDFRMAWTFDSAAVMVTAQGTDGATLYQWWQKNAYLLASS
jgi:hypothetical protein